MWLFKIDVGSDGKQLITNDDGLIIIMYVLSVTIIFTVKIYYQMGKFYRVV